MNRLIIAAAALAISATAFAEEPALKVTPTGRVLMDAAAYDANVDEFSDGVAVPDARIGVKASYGDWKAKLDVGFAYGAVSLKDIFIERKFNDNNLIRLGNFVHQFGLQSSTSSSMKISMEEPTSNEAFGNPRLLGAMYVYDKGQFLATASLHAERSAMQVYADDLGKTGWGGMSRLVWRPIYDGGEMLQVGFSAAASTPQYSATRADNHKIITVGSNFPTRVSKVSAVDATIHNAKAMFKFTPEILMNYGPVALESQYYDFNVYRRDNEPSYHAYGAYALLRGLAIGGNYSYNHADGGIATPAPGSLEFVLGYNYTCLSDHSADIYGGRLNDVSLTANWYINKYMIWRLRGAYTHRFDRAGTPDIDLGSIQTRLQIIF